MVGCLFSVSNAGVDTANGGVLASDSDLVFSFPVAAAVATVELPPDLLDGEAVCRMSALRP